MMKMTMKMMRAKRVYENINFQRGGDPLDSLGIGIQNISQLGPLDKRKTHILKKGDNTQISRGYLLWKLLNFINENNKNNQPVGYADCVRYYYNVLKGQSYKRRSFAMGVWDSLKRYIHIREDRKYVLNPRGRGYLEWYLFFDDKRSSIQEELQFQRGRDPKAALDIGAWRMGYIIDKEPEFDINSNGYKRIKFEGSPAWNFSKKVFNPDEVSQTEIDLQMKKILKPLPVVKFKYYHDTDGFPGLFGDWPDNFPFSRTPFIANCLEEEDRTFLIEPEGYSYARYSTELI